MAILGRLRAPRDGTIEGRHALRRVLTDPIFEVVPLKSLADHVAELPPGALVSVTASPAKGIEATLDWAMRLQGEGFRAIPHLSARMIRDRAHLAELLAAAREAGVTRAFVVGGDADEPGAYRDGLALLRAMDEVGHPFETIGCPCYPKGHPDIPEPVLLRALHEKAAYVDHATTQLEFDTAAIARWVRDRRAAGFGRPFVIGVPGVADPRKLLSVAARIGVRDARRFLFKNLRFVTGLARSGGFYRPTTFVRDLAPLLADPAAKVTGVHLYTFNAVAATEAWRREQLASLEDGG